MQNSKSQAKTSQSRCYSKLFDLHCKFDLCANFSFPAKFSVVVFYVFCIEPSAGKGKSSQTKSKKKVKKNVVDDDDSDFEIDSQLLESEDDDLNDEDLDELVNDCDDEEEEKSKQVKNTTNNYKTLTTSNNFESPDQKQKRATVAANRLDGFGFSKEAKRPETKANRMQTSVKPKNTGKTKTPFSLNEEPKINEMKAMSAEQILEGLPPFLHKDKKRDKNQKLMSDPDYDPTTLYVPKQYYSEQTAAMKQFWDIKSNHQDKVLLFKLGKFYELFYEDAIVGQRELDLNWMGGGKKYHVGFPEKALEKYVPILTNRGYKVAVVEQTETPRQLEKRMQEARKSGLKSVADQK